MAQRVEVPLIIRRPAKEPRAAMHLGPTAALGRCARLKAAVWPPGTPRTARVPLDDHSRVMSMRRKTEPSTRRNLTGVGRKTRVAVGRAPLSPSPAPTAAVPAPAGSRKPIPIRSHVRHRKAPRLRAVGAGPCRAWNHRHRRGITAISKPRKRSRGKVRAAARGAEAGVVLGAAAGADGADDSFEQNRTRIKPITKSANT